MNDRSKKADRGMPGLGGKVLAAVLAFALAFMAFDASLLKSAYAEQGSQAAAASESDSDDSKGEGLVPAEPETEPAAIESDIAEAEAADGVPLEEEGVDARAGPEGVDSDVRGDGVSTPESAPDENDTPAGEPAVAVDEHAPEPDADAADELAPTAHADANADAAGVFAEEPGSLPSMRPDEGDATPPPQPGVSPGEGGQADSEAQPEQDEPSRLEAASDDEVSDSQPDAAEASPQAEGDIACTVTFYSDAADRNPSVVRRVLAQAQPGSTATVDLDAASAEPPAEGQVFAGWHVGGAVRTGQVEIDPAQGDVSLYPSFKSGHWLRYDPRAGDATYVGSTFVGAADDAPSLLPVSTRTGYTFGGWYGETESGGNVVEGSQVADSEGAVLDAGALKARLLEGDVVLHAKWTGAATTYRVVFWLQDPDGGDYSFDRVETVGDEEGERAISGELTGYSNPPGIAGFTVKDVEQETIAGDGSTLINVRYDRVEYSVRFHTQRQLNSPVFGELTITARYGEDIRDSWPQADDPDGRYTTSWYVTPDEDDDVFITGIGTMPLGGADVYPKLDKDLDCNTVFRVQPVDGSPTFEERFDAPFSSENSPSTTADDYLSIIGFQVNAASEQDAQAIRDNAVGDPLAVHVADFETSARIGEKYADAPLVKGEDGKERRTLYFNYLRLKYDVVFFENGGPSVPDAEGVYYEASLAECAPDGYQEGVTTYEASNGMKYTFAGWYENDLFIGEKFDFSNEAMPAGNVTLYAKWEPKAYLVQVDPNGGTFVDPSQSTYFTKSHGAPVGTIAVERLYAPDPEGDFAYEYQTASSDPDDDGFGFVGYVSAPEGETGERFSYAEGVYSLFGWYLVQDGVATSVPYDFSAPVTRDTGIVAKWRSAGVFDIAYSPVMKADGVTVTGEIETRLDDGYADKSPTFIMNTPRAVTSSDGKPYRFLGWRVVSGFGEGSAVLDDTLYAEGQGFVVDSDLARKNVIHLQALYEEEAGPVDPTDPIEPVEPLDPNEPAGPNVPSEPADPGTPSQPSDPVQPDAPASDGPVTTPDSDAPGTPDTQGGAVDGGAVADPARPQEEPESLEGSVSGEGAQGSAGSESAPASDPSSGVQTAMPKTGDMVTFVPLLIAGVMVTAAGVALIARVMRERHERER